MYNNLRKKLVLKHQDLLLFSKYESSCMVYHENYFTWMKKSGDDWLTLDLWLAKDNRFLNPKSSYKRILMAPPCRLIIFPCHQSFGAPVKVTSYGRRGPTQWKDLWAARNYQISFLSVPSSFECSTRDLIHSLWWVLHMKMFHAKDKSLVSGSFPFQQ